MKISVFTPTHKSNWLPEIYKCLLEQTHLNWEWVIVYNNGGKKIGFDDERVKEFVLDYPTNEYVGPMKHLACSKCTGKILLEMDHDDLLTPDALKEVGDAFADQEVGFVYSNTIRATSDLKPGIRFNKAYGWQFREIEYKGHKLDEYISFDPHPSSVSRIWFAPDHLRAFRKTAYDKIGGYRKDMRILDDLDLMCRLYNTTKFRHINKGLYVYRVTGENTWLRYNAEIQDNVYRIYDQYIESLVLRWCDINNYRKLDIGGGINAAPGYESVDLKGASIEADLNESWPFDDGSIGVVRAFDVIEHLRDPLHTMKELYRVLAPGGYALIQVPSTDGRGAFQDPTHVSFWNENSFAYYTETEFAEYIGTPVRFQAIRLYTTQTDERKVCWTIAHLVKLVEGIRYPGLVLI